MHLVEHARNMMVRVGAEWVLWLLLALKRAVTAAGAGTRMLQLEVLSYLHGRRANAESPGVGLESGRAAA